jgi:ferredoxin
MTPKGRLIAARASFLAPPRYREMVAMKIRIERAGCVGNARCAAVSEELFPLDDDGYIASDGFDVPEGMDTLARNGARACPERIIFVVEDDGTTSWPPEKAR